MTRRRKLLVADDSPTIQKVVSLTFADEGLDVLTASGGEHALRVLAEEAPDIVLADVFMPAPNGYEICERVKADARTRHVPVVLLVGTFEPFNQAEARRVGADDVLTKPFQSIRDLVSRVGSLLGGGRPEEDEPVTKDLPEQPQAATQGGPREQRRWDEPSITASGSSVGAEGEGAATPIASSAAEVSFADIAADDTMIEAKPIESIGVGPQARSRYEEVMRRDEQAAPRQQPEPEPLQHADAAPQPAEPAPAQRAEAASQPEAWEAPARQTQEHADDAHGRREAEEIFARDEAASLPRAGAEAFGREGATARAAAQSFAAAGGINEMREFEAVGVAQTGFAARAASAATADDMLLDLGDVDASPASPEAGELILDLADEAPATPAHATPTQQIEATPTSDLHQPETPSAQEASTPGSVFQEAEAFQQPETFQESGSFQESVSQPAGNFGEADAPASLAEAAHGEMQTARDEDDEMPTLITAAPFDAGHAGGDDAAHAGEGSAAASGGPGASFDETETMVAEPVVEEPLEERTQESEGVGVAGADEVSAGARPDEPSASVGAQEPATAAGQGVAGRLSPEDIEAVARRAVELLSERAVRDIAWEVVPQLAELLIKERLDQERK